MSFELTQSARRAADALDNMPESTGAELFRNEYAKTRTREETRQFVEMVDAHEQDGKGLDVVVKRDDQGNPRGFAVIPQLWHQAARQMAAAMDAGNENLAAEINKVVKADIDKGAHDSRDAELKYGLFSIAVDAYEKDGVGRDVTISYGRGVTTKPQYNFDLNRVDA